MKVSKNPLTHLRSCGSSPGLSPSHLTAAISLAHALHTANATLIYGGGTSGLMGTLASTLVSLSGPNSVHGIIPRALMSFEASAPIPSTLSNADAASHVSFEKFGRTTVVDDMHERKALMASAVRKGGKGSGFVGLSGGFGTLEEVMEMTTWCQLGILDVGVVLFDVGGYWEGVVEWVGRAIREGFVKESCRALLGCEREAEGVLRALSEYEGCEGRLKLKWEEK